MYKTPIKVLYYGSTPNKSEATEAIQTRMTDQIKRNFRTSPSMVRIIRSIGPKLFVSWSIIRNRPHIKPTMHEMKIKSLNDPSIFQVIA